MAFRERKAELESASLSSRTMVGQAGRTCNARKGSTPTAASGEVPVRKKAAKQSYKKREDPQEQSLSKMLQQSQNEFQRFSTPVTSSTSRSMFTDGKPKKSANEETRKVWANKTLSESTSKRNPQRYGSSTRTRDSQSFPTNLNRAGSSKTIYGKPVEGVGSSNSDRTRAGQVATCASSSSSAAQPNFGRNLRSVTSAPASSNNNSQVIDLDSSSDDGNDKDETPPSLDQLKLNSSMKNKNESIEEPAKESLRVYIGSMQQASGTTVAPQNSVNAKWIDSCIVERIHFGHSNGHLLISNKFESAFIFGVDDSEVGENLDSSSVTGILKRGRTAESTEDSSHLFKRSKRLDGNDSAEGETLSKATVVVPSSQDEEDDADGNDQLPEVKKDDTSAVIGQGKKGRLRIFLYIRKETGKGDPSGTIHELRTDPIDCFFFPNRKRPESGMFNANADLKSCELWIAIRIKLGYTWQDVLPGVEIHSTRVDEDCDCPLNEVIDLSYQAADYLLFKMFTVSTMNHKLQDHGFGSKWMWRSVAWFILLFYSFGDKEVRLSSVASASLDEAEELFRYPRQGKGVVINYQSFKRLDDRECLDDSVIDMASKFVENENACYSHEQKLELQRTKIFGPFFINKLRTLNSKNLEKVAKWYKETNIFHMNKLLIPVNRDYHWVLIVVANPRFLFRKRQSKETGCIFVMDPMGPKMFAEDMALVCEWLQWEFQKLNFKEQSELVGGEEQLDRRFLPSGASDKLQSGGNFYKVQTCNHDKIPQQPDGYNCGMYVIRYIQKLATFKFPENKQHEFQEIELDEWNFDREKCKRMRLHLQRLIAQRAITEATK